MGAQTTKQYAPGTHPDLPPPVRTTGPIAWMRINLFSSPLNIALTIASVWILWSIVPGILDWVVFNAVWSATDRKDCWGQMAAARDGACWAFIRGSFKLFLYGWYPEDQRWRPNLCFVLFLVAVVGVLRENMPGKKYWLWYAVAFPFIAAWLLVGGFGLPPVSTNKFGGILLTVVIGVTGIAFSLPIGILLALGRRSNLPTLRTVCVVFIEFIRGVPLITLLFVASTMLTYLLPPCSTFELLMSVLIMVRLWISTIKTERRLISNHGL